MGSGEVYAPCVVRRGGEEVVSVVFWEKGRKGVLIMDFKNLMPVPDSVHGFWWKAARWEVFFLLFLADSFLAAQYFPNDFATAFCLQFGLLCVQLLGSLAIPAGFRIYAGKQSGIAVSAVFACVAAIVFNMFSMWIYGGSIPQENPLPIVDFILTVAAGYKVVRRECWPSMGEVHFQRWGAFAAMAIVGVGIAICSCSYVGFGRLKTTGCVIFGLAAGGSFFYVSRFVEDSFKKASAGYRSDDPGKALAYAAMGLLCLLVWIGMLAGMYSVLRNLRW